MTPTLLVTTTQNNVVTIPAGGVANTKTIFALLAYNGNSGTLRNFSASDTRGNTWILDATNQASGNSGTEALAIFRCVVSTALQAGDTVTFTDDQGTSSNRYNTILVTADTSQIGALDNAVWQRLTGANNISVSTAGANELIFLLHFSTAGDATITPGVTQLGSDLSMAFGATADFWYDNQVSSGTHTYNVNDAQGSLTPRLAASYLGPPTPVAPVAPALVSQTSTSITTNPGALTTNATTLSRLYCAHGGAPGSATTVTPSVSNTLSGLSAGTEYDIRTDAVNDYGSTPGSALLSAWTLATAPGAVTLTVISGTAIDAAIPALSGGAASYNLQVSTASDFGSDVTTFTGVTPSATTHVTGLTADTDYYFRLVAVNGNGDLSNGASSSATDGPVAPSAPTASGGYGYNEVEIDVPTELSGGADTYTLETAPDSTGSPGTWSSFLTGVTTATAGPIIVPGLTAATKYWFRWVAVGAGAISTAGTAMSITTESYVAKPATVFSTGILTVEATGDTPDGYHIPDGGLVLATLQDISQDLGREERRLYEAAWLSTWPVDVSFFNAKVSIKASYATFNQDGLQLLIAGAQSGTNPITNTLSKICPLPPFKLVVILQDTSGNQIRFTWFKVYAPNLTISAKQAGHALQDVDFDAVPGDDGRLGTIEFKAGAF